MTLRRITTLHPLGARITYYLKNLNKDKIWVTQNIGLTFIFDSRDDDDNYWWKCIAVKGGLCTIYDKRPEICRKYRCQNYEDVMELILTDNHPPI